MLSFQSLCHVDTITLSDSSCSALTSHFILSATTQLVMGNLSSSLSICCQMKQLAANEAMSVQKGAFKRERRFLGR